MLHFSMSARVIGCGVIYNTDLRKIVQQLCCAPEMKCIAVSEQQAGKAVYPGPVQILTDDPLVSPLVPTVEQPVRASGLQVNGSSSADIQNRNSCNKLFGPMRMFDVKMPTRNVRE